MSLGYQKILVIVVSISVCVCVLHEFVCARMCAVCVCVRERVCVDMCIGAHVF